MSAYLPFDLQHELIRLKNNKNEPVTDHVAGHRGSSLLFDKSTHFAKSTKAEGIPR
jgi:hypothetical protein